MLILLSPKILERLSSLWRSHQFAIAVEQRQEIDRWEQILK